MSLNQPFGKALVSPLRIYSALVKTHLGDTATVAAAVRAVEIPVRCAIAPHNKLPNAIHPWNASIWVAIALARTQVGTAVWAETLRLTITVRNASRYSLSCLMQYLQIFNRDRADRPARGRDKFSVVLPKARTLRKPNLYGELLVANNRRKPK